jgi:hypothetical protein
MQRNGVLRCRGTYPGNCEREAASSHGYRSNPQRRRPVLNVQHVVLHKAWYQLTRRNYHLPAS